MYSYIKNKEVITAFPPDNCRREFYIVRLPIDNRGKPREKKKKEILVYHMDPPPHRII